MTTNDGVYEGIALPGREWITCAEPTTLPLSPKGPGELSLIGGWYWLLAGRSFISTFEVTLHMTPEERRLVAARALHDLVTYIDSVMPPRGRTSAPQVQGPAVIGDGGLLPLPKEQ